MVDVVPNLVGPIKAGALASPIKAATQAAAISCFVSQVILNFTGVPSYFDCAGASATRPVPTSHRVGFQATPIFDFPASNTIKFENDRSGATYTITFCPTDSFNRWSGTAGNIWGLRFQGAPAGTRGFVIEDFNKPANFGTDWQNLDAVTVTLL